MSTIQAFLAECRNRNLRPGTVSQKRNCLRRLVRAHDGADPVELNTEQLREFVFRVDIEPESQATELSHLRTYYRWALCNGHRGDDPTAVLARPRTHRRLPRPISEANLALALDTAPDRIYPMLVLAGWAGLRAIEISGLRGEFVLWDETPPILLLDEQKGGDQGSVPIAPFLLEKLIEHAPRRGWVFPRHDDRPGTTPPWLVSQLCNQHLHSLGLADTLHSLRHRFGTQVYKASGGDLRLTQELMRHKTPVSTAIYTWVDPADAVKVVAGLPKP